MSARTGTFVDAVRLELADPAGEGELAVMVDPAQRALAWALYVELTTRVSVEAVAPAGLTLGVAIGAHRDLLTAIRAALLAAGPDSGTRSDTVGGLAVRLVERELTPFLATYGRVAGPHAPKALHHAPGEAFVEPSEVWTELEALRVTLRAYAATFRALASARP